MESVHRRGLLCTRLRDPRGGRDGRDRPHRALRNLKLPRQELLQFKLAPVACRLDQRSRVLLCEMGCNQADPGQMEATFGDRMEEDGELARGASRLDAPLG